MSQFSNSNMFFVEQTLKFESKIINNEFVPLLIPDAKFGLLNLKALTSSITEEELELIFTVDCSGSMSDMCSDGRSKMQHIIHTLKNMVVFFKETPVLKACITIYAFDDLVYNIVDRISVTDENFALIISKINQIIPRASTNIQVALSHVNKKITQIKTDHPTHAISHIFMTDGEATTGSQDHTVLAEIVDRSVSNIFIGFGIEHDGALLKAVSAGTHYFIDKLENAGLVYGEILNNIVYKLLVNVRITITNGIIYDFKNNVWTDSLAVGEIISESNKIYHVASSNPAECFALLSAQTVPDKINVEIIIDRGEDTDLSVYVYRQRTLQLLFTVNEFLKNKNNFDTGRYTNYKDEEKVMKEKLTAFIKEMKQFMTDNNLVDDKIMKNLCDDIYICHRTFGTRFGAMYVDARQTSQGAQRLYTVSHTPDEDVYDVPEICMPSRQSSAPPGLRRNYTATSSKAAVHFDSEVQEVPELNHELSNFEDSPYLTPLASGMMRALSSGYNDNEEESV